jgi:hypothetical protein
LPTVLITDTADLPEDKAAALAASSKRPTELT